MKKIMCSIDENVLPSRQVEFTKKIFDYCHHVLDESELEKTDDECLYKSPEALTEYIYINGFYLNNMNPYILAELNINNQNLSAQEIMKLWADEADKLEEMFKTDPETVFALCDKKIAMNRFIERFDEIDDRKKYDCFIKMYTVAESGFEKLDLLWPRICSAAKLSKKRNKRLEKLRKKINDKLSFDIYHGHSLTYPINDYNSWTLSKETAEFFAYRHHSRGEVWKASVVFNDSVIDYLTDRNEEEILVNIIGTIDLSELKYEVIEKK